MICFRTIIVTNYSLSLLRADIYLESYSQHNQRNQRASSSNTAHKQNACDKGEIPAAAERSHSPPPLPPWCRSLRLQEVSTHSSRSDVAARVPPPRAAVTWNQDEISCARWQTHPATSGRHALHPGSRNLAGPARTDVARAARPGHGSANKSDGKT